jgi:hypothetical protein
MLKLLPRPSILVGAVVATSIASGLALGAALGGVIVLAALVRRR